MGRKGVSARSSRRSSFVMATPPLMLMSPEGVLHLVPAAKKPRKAFCEAHGLRVAYLRPLCHSLHALHQARSNLLDPIDVGGRWLAAIVLRHRRAA